MEKRLGCSSCLKYSYKLSRCIDGKINPRTIKGGVDAARFMGLGYICQLSPIKAKIVKKIVGS